ncbi:MAG: agmatine deiminase [Verrucomicrobia bacterium]|nr:agmatine deiminase [Verrucomicrobiota bacterium]
MRPRLPAEWEPHAAVWTAWPSHPVYWGDAYTAACGEMARFLKALSEPVHGCAVPERVEVWADGAAAMAAAVKSVAGERIRWVEASFGDIWFRDIAPVVVTGPDGRQQARCLRHNGWGEKYRMPGDGSVAARMVARHRLPARFLSLTGEGGGLEGNGEGVFITTRSCFLNTNRNPGAKESLVEEILRREFGAETVLWLEDGLVNDHTDGHVDNLARFVDSRTVVCQHPSGADDPNRERLREIAAALRKFRLPSGARLEVAEIPSPGKVPYEDGTAAPASHINFYIANHRVLVPCYGGEEEEKALTILQELFPTRQVVGLPARSLLAGGGAFHCVTQQVPRKG